MGRTTLRLGLYMNARRVIPGTGDLNGSAVSNIEQLLALRDRGGIGGLDVLIRLSRDQALHQRQSPDGLDSTSEPMWTGVREFPLAAIGGSRLTPDIGSPPPRAATTMLTAPALASFLRSLRKGADPATTTLVLWGHADGPSGMLFARRPDIRPPSRNASTRPSVRTALSRPRAGGVAAAASNRLSRDILSPADAQKAFAAATGSAGKLGLVCFDACQAACIEFAALLAPHADLLIASQTPVPGAGWNYGSWPSHLPGMTKSTRRARAVAIADDFARLRGRNLSVSVTDLSKVPAIIAALRPVSDALVASRPLRTALAKVRAQVRTQDDDVGGSVDLVGLFDAAAKKLGNVDADFARACARVAAAGRNAIASAQRSPDIPRRIPLTGLSIFYPTAKSGLGDTWDDITDRIYFGNPNQLRAFKLSNWHRFLALDRRDRKGMSG